MAEPLIIKDWDLGVAQSPHKGFGKMRNIDIESMPGAARPQKKPTAQFEDSYSEEVTANASTDVLTATDGTMPITGVAVHLTTTGTLPAGLSTGTVYFVIKSSATECKLATTIANADSGTQIDITDTGTGTHTMQTVNPGTIRHFAKDPRTSDIFCIDSNGRVWYALSNSARLLHNSGLDSGSGSLANASGKGLALFAASDESAVYLFAFRNAVVDVVDVLGTTEKETPSWNNGWQSLNGTSGFTGSHQAILGRDNILYFCDDQYVGSIQEDSGQVFDPATGATFTYNNQALDLSPFEEASWIAERDVSLYIAGKSFNKIYPWDRTSSSFDLPIFMPEPVVDKIINAGGIIYILCGTKGNIYTSQGSYAQFLTKIPEYLTNNSATPVDNLVTWGGIESRGTTILVGVETQTSGNEGVYIIYPDGRIVHDNIPSSGAANVTALFTEGGDFYYQGYNGGVDVMDTKRWEAGDIDTGLEPKIDSPLYQLSSLTKKGTLSKLEVVTAKPAGTGRLVVRYREDIDENTSFTQIGSFSADSSSVSFETDIGLIDLDKIQFQIAICEDWELLELRLWP